MKNNFFCMMVLLTFFFLNSVPVFSDELDFIGEDISRGNKGDDIRKELEYIALEGLTNQTRENGRLMNNSPDIRARAVVYLGELGTAEATASLLKIMRTEKEPLVLTLTIKSLAKIGLNDNEETTNTIAWVVSRFDALVTPDNLLALSAVDAFDILAKKNGGIRDSSVRDTLNRIIKGRYIKPVQNRAQQVMLDLRQYDIK
jgi:hypothetical protein